MNILPISNTPALLIDDSVLVVADLHIGIEEELKEAGFILPSQTEKMIDSLVTILKDTKPEKIIILGDLKHNIPMTSKQEWSEIPDIIRAAQEYVDEIEILPGNHDGGIRNMVADDVHIGISKGNTIGEVGLFHGHAWPSEKVMKSKVAITAHNHPVVVFVDKLGMRTSKRCWMRTNFRRKSERYSKMPKELVVMPAFNEFCGGTPVNDPKSDFLGPLLSNKFLVLKKSKIHLLDGTHLGVLSDLMLQI
ncbi:MAG: metallophosphoesterase [Methanobacteriota archaeon]|nr:MAG: metallophosphoesterase [Euryarchaeota archaeon]